MVKRRWMICREGVAYLCVLAFVSTGAILRDINLLLIVAGMMLAPLFYNAAVALFGLRKLQVRRNVPQGVFAGEPFTVEIALANDRRRRPVWGVTVEDNLVRLGAAHETRSAVGVLFPVVRAGQTARQAYSGCAPQRGRYRFGKLKLATRFPFGLFRGVAWDGASDQLVVFPRLGRLAARWNSWQADRQHGSRRQRRANVASDGEFFGLRDWRPGDTRRGIHWRTSARRGALVVRQLEQRRSEDLVVALDLHFSAQPTDEERRAVEKGISFAATVAADRCRRGTSRLTLVWGEGEAGRVSGAASQALQHEILTALADYAPPADSVADVALASAVQAARATDVLVITNRGGELGLNPRDGDGRQLLVVRAGSDDLDQWFAEV